MMIEPLKRAKDNIYDRFKNKNQQTHYCAYLVLELLALKFGVTLRARLHVGVHMWQLIERGVG